MLSRTLLMPILYGAHGFMNVLVSSTPSVFVSYQVAAGRVMVTSKTEIAGTWYKTVLINIWIGSFAD